MAEDDPAVRAWAAGQGIELGTRGRIPAEVRARYDSEHEGQADAGDPGTGAGESAAGPPPGREHQEQRPRDVPGRSRWRRGGGGRAGAGRAAPGAKKKAKPKKPRVPVDDLIAGAWRGMAGFARPIPPTSRLLKIQAPAAGLLLEDIAKDTVADRLLQPFARGKQGSEVLFSLIGPPVLVTMMSARPDSMPLLMPVLRESLLAMAKVMGPKMSEALRREAEFEEEFGQSVDDLIAFLFNGAVVHEDETPDQAEEASVRYMHGLIQGTVAS